MVEYFALHGFTGTNRSFDPLQLDSVEPVRNVHRVLLGGHGREADLSRTSFAEEVRHFCELVRATHDEPVHLLGYSMGARIALSMLLSEPSLFSHASLIGANPGLETQVQRDERQSWENAWVRMLEHEGLEKFEAAWSQQQIFASQHLLRAEVRDSQQKARLSHTSSGLAHAMTTLGLGRMPNLWPQLGGLKVPTQLIVGQKDAKFSTLAKRMRAESPLFQLTLVADAGHNPVLESPEQVRRILLEPAGFDSAPPFAKARLS